MASLFAVSCSQENESSRTKNIQTILNHAPSLSDANEHAPGIASLVSKSTVAIKLTMVNPNDRSESFIDYCSGTIIDNQHIMSARHCFVDITSFPSGDVAYALRDVEVIFSNNADCRGREINCPITPSSHIKKASFIYQDRERLLVGSETQLDPDFNNDGKIISNISDFFPVYHDVALLKVNGSIPRNYAPVKLNASNNPSNNVDLWISGFGVTRRNGPTSFDGSGSWVRTGDISYSAFREYASTGDNGKRSLDLIEYQPGKIFGSRACFSDSGGSLYGRKYTLNSSGEKVFSGDWELYGVISSGQAAEGSECAGAMFATDVRKIQTWISAAKARRFLNRSPALD